MSHVIVLDTGVNLLHPLLSKKNIICKTITNNGCEVLYDNSDQVGHGTAICGIIMQKNPDIKLTMYKVFDRIDYADENKLLDTLEYIVKNEEFNYLHMSLGISLCNEMMKFEKLCTKLVENNVVIVSAFSNYGVASYPAAFDDVIGVDTLYECKKNDDFIYLKNSIVNIYGKGSNQRVCWSNNTNYIVNSGNSFAAAHITAFLINKLKKGQINLKQAKNVLKKNSKYIKTLKKIEDKKINFEIKNIAVFPLNKEIYSMLNYCSLLKYNVSAIFDIRESGKIGNNIKKYLFRDECDESLIIQNVNNLSNYKNEFDTLVIGHLNKIMELTSIDYKTICIDYCLNNNKNLISFDDLPEEVVKKFKEKKLNCFYCNVKTIDYDINEKLRIISTPNVAVCGTSSQQGKFSLQLELRKKFLLEGYLVGQWCSEPQGYLFDFDEIFPLGYGSNIHFSEKQIIHYINNQLYLIEKKEKDIIISGTQSLTLCENLYNTIFYPSLQNSILSALQPDCVILVVNSYDDIEYIKRTIMYIESVCNTKVICLVISFKAINKTWSSMELSTRIIDEEESNIYKNIVANKLCKPCYSYNEIDKIFYEIQKYLS